MPDLVARTLEKQGVATTVSTGESISIDDLGPEQARNLIADDGLYGVEQTVDRIVEFAIIKRILRPCTCK